MSIFKRSLRSDAFRQDSQANKPNAAKTANTIPKMAPPDIPDEVESEGIGGNAVADGETLDIVVGWSAVVVRTSTVVEE